MSNNNNNTMMFWKKSFPLCSFSISKCLPTIASSAVRSSKQLNDHDSRNDDDNLLEENPNNSDESRDQDPDFSTVFVSDRFFFSSPGKSNSIVDQHTTTTSSHSLTSSSSSPEKYNNNNNNKDIVIQKHRHVTEVRKFSADPRLDFRRSMREMIEARHRNHDHIIDDDDDDDDRSDLEYLHELLLCFLALNPKDTHKYVISAFTDIVVDLLSVTDIHSRRRREVKLRRKRSGFRRMSM